MGDRDLPTRVEEDVEHTAHGKRIIYVEWMQFGEVELCDEVPIIWPVGARRQMWQPFVFRRAEWNGGFVADAFELELDHVVKSPGEHLGGDLAAQQVRAPAVVEEEPLVLGPFLTEP